MIAVALLAACAPAAPGTLTLGEPVAHATETSVDEDDDEQGETGLEIQLSEPDGGATTDAPDATAPPAPMLVTDPLTQQRVDELLARVPALPERPERVADFAFPEPTLSPPRPGEHVTTVVDALDATRPPPALASADASTPLEVLRVTPSGETVGPVPTITLVFSAPMVPISSVDEVAALDVPVSLSPQVPGRWRWLGTTTLVFEADEHLPMATHVTVTVDADRARSVHGQRLADDVVHTVSTAPPRVRSVHPAPHTPTVLAPVVVVTFDQPVDDEGVLPFITLEGSWLREWPLRLATADEIAEITADDAPSHVRRRDWDPETMVALRPVEPLPAGERVRVVVEQGVPALEGPRTSVKRHVGEFRTRGDLEVTDVRCGWRGCAPGTPWTFTFANPLEASTFVADDIAVEPEVRIVDTRLAGSSITILADGRGGTRYDVTFPPALGDVFGQTFGEQSPASVSVGHAEPALPQGWSMHVADPMAPPRHPVVTRNVDGFEVVVLRVQPTDWEVFTVQQTHFYNSDTGYTLPGEIVFDGRIDVDAVVDEQGVTFVDLSEHLDENDRGHLVVCLRALPGDRGVLESSRATDSTTGRAWRSVTWIQHTGLALDVTSDDTGATAWVTRLTDGEPVDGARVAVSYAPDEATVDASGAARLGPVPAGRRNHAIATHGDDAVILDGLYHTGVDEPAIRWVFVDDRPLYEPGQTVRIKGWARRMDRDVGGDLTGVAGWLSQVRWTATDPRGVELGEGTVQPNDHGGFVVSFDLPEGVNLGQTRVTFTPQIPGDAWRGRSQRTTHTVRVLEFRRPEFEVGVDVTEGPHVIGGEAIATAAGTYLSGGALPDAGVSWRVTSTRASYAPPGWPGFSFGTWTPWWGWRHGGPDVGENTLTWSATTDEAGEHALALRFVSVSPPRSSSVSVKATIEDVNRQAWSGSASFVVHPAQVYVGLRTESTYVEDGETIEGEVVVTDIDGGVVAGRPVDVVARLTSWRMDDGEWAETEIARRQVRVTSAEQPVPFALEPGDDPERALGGRWTLNVSTTDAEGRANESERTLWAAGGARPPEGSERLPLETVELVPDRETYADGDVAKVLVQAPFAPAHGVLTLLREGVVERRELVLDEPTTVLEIPIDDAYVPNVYLHVELVGAAPRDAGRLDVSGIPLEPPPRPAYAQGELMLSVPPIRRALDIAIAPRDDALLPGGDTTLDLRVTGHDGEPVTDAEVAVIVVDEALYALTGAGLPDPLGVLYPDRPGDTRFERLRASVLLSSIRWDEAAGEWRFASADDDGPQAIGEQEEEMHGMLKALGYVDGGGAVARDAAPPAALSARKAAGFMAAGAYDDDFAGDAAPAIDVRTDFDAVAAFVPDARTDADGTIAVPITMPDSLTRYRIVAVALDRERRAGVSEGSVTVRLPLMLRPSAPRFLSWGDVCELPVVLQNGTDDAMLVDVAAAAAGIELTGAAGKRVTVPANDRVEVRFDVATTDVGEADFRFVAAAVEHDHADAASASFPVWTPATSETFAAVGAVDDGGIAQTVRMPRDVITQFGGLSVSTSSTALASLADALIHVYDYPYGCVEQRASRLIGTLSMLDVVDAFTGLDDMPTRDEILARAAHDVEELQKRQLESGAFGWWSRSDEIQPYLTAHAASALLVAREHDVAVPDDVLTAALDVLDELPYDSEAERRVVSSYAASVLARAGREEAHGLVRDVLARVDSPRELPTDAVSWLLEATAHAGGALSTEGTALERELLNRVHESTSKAHVTTERRVEDATVLLSSSKRSDAIATSALIAAAPGSDAIVKLVRGLQGDRVKGRWRTTQENVFVLRALRGYFDAFESEPPAFTAGTWLAGRLAAEARFEGRDTLQDHVEVPLATVASLAESSSDDAETQDLPLVIAKDGRGRLYWRAALRTAPANLALDAADAGFTVTRTYAAVDDPDDVRQDDDGTWRIRAGATVRVTVTMTTPMVRHHVALVDPLPGGFEPVNPSLAASPSTGDALEPDATLPWWRRVWYVHQNLRDERAEAFATTLWPGAHSYRYVARATTPGRFVAGPPKAEEMYEPETFGRGGTDVVVVEPAGR